MKYLVKDYQDLIEAERWYFDYHSPLEEIKCFPENQVVQVSQLAKVSKEKLKDLQPEPSRKEKHDKNLLRMGNRRSR